MGMPSPPLLRKTRCGTSGISVPSISGCASWMLRFVWRAENQAFQTVSAGRALSACSESAPASRATDRQNFSLRDGFRGPITRGISPPPDISTAPRTLPLRASVRQRSQMHMAAGHAGFKALCDRLHRLAAGEYPQTLLLSNEGCRRCGSCSYPDGPCRLPDVLFPSIEGYGIRVKELADAAGIAYNNGKNTVTYFGALFFRPGKTECADETGGA